MLFVSWPLKDVNLCYPKVDKIFASVLPIGSYPLSVGRISVIVRLSWLVSIIISIREALKRKINWLIFFRNFVEFNNCIKKVKLHIR